MTSAHTATLGIRAGRQTPAAPRPQLLRAAAADLTGEWGFAHDDDDRGLADGWHDGRELGSHITVPFPPESIASGIGATGFHPVVWYRRAIGTAELAAAAYAAGDRLLLHFGAVDYDARVWLDGRLVGRHEGGHTPFTLDLTDAIGADAGEREHVLVVRAEDDPHDVAKPRGKQDWLEQPHAIWYHRTTGIWQPVWLEAVHEVHIRRIHWTSDLDHGTATAQVDLSRPIRGEVVVRIAHDDAVLGESRVTVDGSVATATVPLAGQDNGQGYERLLWRPGSPTLLDAWVEVETGGGVVDVAASYLGLRSVAARDGRFLLNDRPIVLRSVLEQGYWPESHLAAPSEAALRREAELILELGFNAVRVHQKLEDPRFLFHADRLGLLVWDEMPSSYAFSDTSVRRTVAEWTEAVLRDRSHPSVVAWVPLNESWGVQHIASRADQRAFAEALYQLTRSLDGTRPVISNDGWELGTSDMWNVHDYEASGEVLARRYDVPEAELRRLVAGIGPAGRRIRLDGTADAGQPIMLTEFGGVKWSPDADIDGSWGYSEADGDDDFEWRLADILQAVQAATIGHGGRATGLAGWCWTQLTDTLQERNGLLTEDRVPKLPLATLRSLIEGAAPTPHHRRAVRLESRGGEHDQ
jgi:hypothetical protein